LILEIVSHNEAAHQPTQPTSTLLCSEDRAVVWLEYDAGSLRSGTFLSKALSGFVLPGGGVRLHVVDNPLFWRLLKRFGDHAPAPMLVNPSFNLFGDPLIVSPRDAIRGHFCSGIDALVIHNFVLSKASTMHILRPLLGEHLEVGV
jgi:Carbamoyltransferase C-terminus